MNKEIIIYKKDGYFSSPIIPKDLNNKDKKYTYFKDCVFDVLRYLK